MAPTMKAGSKRRLAFQAAITAAAGLDFCDHVVHQSFAFDLRIVVETIKVVLLGIDRSRLDVSEPPPTAIQ